MILSTNGEAIIGKWLMDSPLFVYKLCLGTEQKDVFVSIFFALLPAVHCLQLQAAVPYEAFCHALQKKKRKALIFCVLKPARWHKETIRKPVLRDYQTNYRARSRCREQQLFDFKDPDNSVCLIIHLYIWLTDKPWLSPQRICDLVSSESRAGILLHQTQVTFLFSSYL